MPSCPMAMPSSTPMVLNSKGTAPAARTASLTSRRILEVGVAGDDVDVRVADGDERLIEVAALPDLAGGAQETAVGRAFESAFDRVRSHRVGPEGGKKRPLPVGRGLGGFANLPNLRYSPHPHAEKSRDNERDSNEDNTYERGRHYQSNPCKVIQESSDTGCNSWATTAVPMSLVVAVAMPGRAKRG